jgi:oligopeptide transport system permease protein
MATTPQEVLIDTQSRVGELGSDMGGVPVRQSSLWRDAVRRYARNRGALLAAIVFALVVLFCLLAPVISPYDPNGIDYAVAQQGPSADHWFGTDQFGRDLLTRAAVGGRVSIGIGLAATFAILVIGVTYGAIAGFVGGWLDNGLMRFLDALYGLPYLPFAILTLAILGNSRWAMIIALTVASWFTTARIVRGQIITLKENDYVRAARAVGARWHRVLLRHLLPNTLGVLIIAVFLELPAVILGEAFLSFIGLGIGAPDASWGSMAQDGRDVFRVAPFVIVIPGLAIATLVLCANFVADGLRDALDPRTRET